MFMLTPNEGAFSVGFVLDFVRWKPHVHFNLGWWTLTIGRGQSYENIHEG